MSLLLKSLTRKTNQLQNIYTIGREVKNISIKKWEINYHLVYGNFRWNYTICYEKPKNGDPLCCSVVGRVSVSVSTLVWKFNRWVGAWCSYLAQPTLAQLGVFLSHKSQASFL